MVRACLKWGHIARLAVILTACASCEPDRQRPVVSLDQARQVTARFQGQVVKPPPRSISDVTSILDAERPDPNKIGALARIAQSQPTPGLSGESLAQFYFERGNAAAELGRGVQAALDAKLAFETAEQARVPFTRSRRYLAAWIGYEVVVGNSRTARELGLKRLAREQSIPGMLSATTNAARAAITLGDIDTARSEIERLPGLLAQVAAVPGMPDPTIWDGRRQMALAYSSLALETGRFAEAERHLRESLAFNARLIEIEPSWTSSNNIPPRTYSEIAVSTRQLLAAALMRQGRLIEAEIEARASLLASLALTGRYAPRTVQAVNILAEILMERGRFEEAERLVRTSFETLQALEVEESSPSFGRVIRLLAQAQSLGGKWVEAAATYESVRARLAPNPDAMRATFDRNLNYALVALRTKNTTEAERVASALAERNAQLLGEQHWDTAMSRGVLGAALLEKGSLAEALRQFDAAAPVLTRPSRQADEEEAGSIAREIQLKIVLEALMSALARSGRGDAAERTFQLADVVRGSSVQRALAQSAARVSTSDPALADLVRQEQDAQKQIGALRRLLNAVLASPNRDEPVVETLRNQIETLRPARDRIRQEIERRFPAYAELIDPKPATVEAARRALRSSEALIAFYVGEDRTFVWATPKSGQMAFAAVPIGRKRIGEAVAALRKSLDPNAATLGDIPTFDVVLAHALYRDLLGPVESGFSGARDLLIAPHDALGQLPLAVLVTEPVPLRSERPGEALFANYKDVSFLIRKAAITQLPSVGSLTTLRAAPAPSKDRLPFVGFGDPWFSSQQATEAKAETATQAAPLQTRAVQTRGLPLRRRNAPATQAMESADLSLLPRLPETADEVREIARALSADTNDVILGAQANENTVKSMDLSRRRVVMFATHGLIPGDLDGLAQPALALSSPSVADVSGDGLLTLDEVLGLKLDADWVILSACNTATGEGAGAEAVSGLGRAFFYAGTRALLASNWPIETNSARALTTDLFDRQTRDPSLPRAQALRQTMLGLIDGPGALDAASSATLFAYSHPIFWAPFSLIGDGGAPRSQTAEARP